MDVISPTAQPASAALRCLIAAGMPIAGVRGPPPELRELRDAVHSVMGESGIEPWVLEAVAAWIMAWAHEWPSGLRESFHPDRDAVAAFWGGKIGDRNRYLKLRRIAIGNLATRL